MIICGGLFFLWKSFLLMRISSYLWSSVGVFPFFENLFLSMIIYENLSFLWDLFLSMIICESLSLLWESLLIHDHLWESFPFMRISSDPWSSVRISSYLWSIILLLIFYHTYPSPSVRTDSLLFSSFMHSSRSVRIFMNINN